MPRRPRTTRSSKNRVSNVRVVDSLQGTDGARVDRIIGSMQNAHSQIRLICGDYSTLATSASATTFGTYSGSNVRATDDFVSMAQQFETYRISAIRFEIYDVNPNLSVFSSFSTQHDVVPSGATFGTPTIQSILDAPDAQLPVPGGSKAVLSWVAHGTEENNFQSTTTGGTPSDFGGLRYFVGSPGSAASKFQIVIKAIVDFRGRV